MREGRGVEPAAIFSGILGSLKWTENNPSNPTIQENTPSQLALWWIWFLHVFWKDGKIFLVIFCSFSIIYDIFWSLHIKARIEKDPFSFNEKFWKPVFGPQTPIFILHFCKRSTRISNVRPEIRTFDQKFDNLPWYFRGNPVICQGNLVPPLGNPGSRGTAPALKQRVRTLKGKPS